MLFPSGISYGIDGFWNRRNVLDSASVALQKVRSLRAEAAPFARSPRRAPCRARCAQGCRHAQTRERLEVDASAVVGEVVV